MSGVPDAGASERLGRRTPSGSVTAKLMTPPVVLVIDDDELSRRLVRRALSKVGYDVVTAPDGAEGYRLAKTTRPSLVICDVVMPDADGWEALAKLKDDPDLGSIPVVMVSSLEDKVYGMSLGASDYLTKPIDREALVEVVEGLVRTEEP